MSVKNYQNSFYSAQKQRKKKEKSATQKTLGLSHNNQVPNLCNFKEVYIKP